MAAIASPFKFTYGAQAVGGASGVYQIDGPHTISKTFEELTFEFIVVVVATSYADLQNQSDTLETAFRKRDQTLVIDLDNIADPGGASTWTYSNGFDLLNIRSEIDKTGDETTDVGFSRSYAITVTGELPSDDIDGSALFTGLRDIEFVINYSSSRQRQVTMRGTYTATPAQTSPVRAAKLARANYEDAATGADAEAITYLAALAATPAPVGPTAFELIAEDVSPEDRNNHTVDFTRIYAELLEDQISSIRDADNIRDHSFSFEELIDQPGDSRADLFRLRRVHARYECGVDITKGVAIQTVFEDEIRPHIKALFQTKFSPSQFCVERRNVQYDRTTQRLTARMTFLYQKAGGDNLIEIHQSVRLEESQTLDTTPMHENNVFAAELDLGWATRTRTTTVESRVIGDSEGRSQLPGGSEAQVLSGGGKGGAGDRSVPSGGLSDANGVGRGPGGAASSGIGVWTTIGTRRESSSDWIGDPNEPQILVTTLFEEKVEIYTETPSGRVARQFK